MEMIKGYRDLEVYQRAYKNSLNVHRISLTFPKIEQYELGSQIRRASKSIAMNIAEGFGKNGGTNEFKRYLGIALGSCEEVRVQLEYCKDLGYIDAKQYESYENEYVIIGKMIAKMIQNWQ